MLCLCKYSAQPRPPTTFLTGSRRHQVIIKEKLKFPSGFSTAVLISVLHGDGKGTSKQQLETAAKGGFASLATTDEADDTEEATLEGVNNTTEDDNRNENDTAWATNLRLLVLSFLISGICTVLTYFIPILRDIPMFGTAIAHNWLWTFNPSLAYVGQGIIMGTETTMHMLLGAVLGWAVLSPLAKSKGWAPGPVDDWEEGSKGWIIWISLSIMLVDAVVSLAYIAFGELARNSKVIHLLPKIGLGVLSKWASKPRHSYEPIQTHDDDETRSTDIMVESLDQEEQDAPPEQRIAPNIVVVGLILSVLLCIATVHLVFGTLIPVYATVIAVLMALVLSIMGVRALGETDLNPVSGISKLAQLFFALIIPQSNKSSVLINLIAGAIVSN